MTVMPDPAPWHQLRVRQCRERTSRWALPTDGDLGSDPRGRREPRRLDLPSGEAPAALGHGAQRSRTVRGGHGHRGDHPAYLPQVSHGVGSRQAGSHLETLGTRVRRVRRNPQHDLDLRRAPAAFTARDSFVDPSRLTVDPVRMAEAPVEGVVAVSERSVPVDPDVVVRRVVALRAGPTPAPDRRTQGLERAIAQEGQQLVDTCGPADPAVRVLLDPGVPARRVGESQTPSLERLQSGRGWGRGWRPGPRAREGMRRRRAPAYVLGHGSSPAGDEGQSNKRGEQPGSAHSREGHTPRTRVSRTGFPATRRRGSRRRGRRARGTGVRFRRGSQAVSYRNSRPSSVRPSAPPMHSVTSSPVSSTCTPPGQVPTPRCTSKKPLHLLDDVVERPRLHPRRRLKSVAVHGIADPHDVVPAGGDLLHDGPQGRTDVPRAHPSDERQPAGLVGRVEPRDQGEDVVRASPSARP